MHAIWLMVGFISNLTTTNGLCITKDKVSIAYSLDTLFDKMVHMDKITMGYFLVENIGKYVIKNLKAKIESR